MTSEQKVESTTLFNVSFYFLCSGEISFIEISVDLTMIFGLLVKPSFSCLNATGSLDL